MLVTPQLPLDVYEDIKQTTRRFAQEVIRPRAEQLDKDSTFPRDIYHQMGELGLLGITAPEEHGGIGLDTLSYAIVMEELSRGYASIADQCGLVELITFLLSKYGHQEQQNRLFPQILTAEKFVAYCITEAEAGSDVSNIRTTATKTEQGWQLSGEKIWIHNAPVADYAFVLARTDLDAGHRGMSIFIVDCTLEGVSKAPKEEKMGQRASQVGSLLFDDVQLEESALLGEENRGFYMMMSALDKGRVGIAALATGIAQAGLEASVEFSQTRKQFGNPISHNQGLQWMMADMAKEIAAARALVHQAAMLLDAGKPATKACSIAKCYAGDTAVAQSANAAQIHGGGGFIRGVEAERLYRDAKITQIYEGTNQIQRTIIARELLKNGAES
ncbi:acyl-CoA dehydrogenase family protein [Vibrio penaeicida]|uniref:acyl-CoA dehydrogenase family protein n=1 Tax=Vibrio penaeicida TaxID=104609 RepID=UPI000CEA2CEB|nr:acyl-CoA dehydrogenase family protein [Vibrio penaeicida]